MPKSILFCLLFILLTAPISCRVAAPSGSGYQYRIGVFNPQILGPSKMSNAEVAAVLATIVREHDVLIVQEVRDASMEAPRQLLELVNAQPPTEYLSGDPREAEEGYDMSIGERSGDSVSKEQNAVFFRRYAIAQAGNFTVPDFADVFERQPYAVRLDLYASALSQSPGASPVMSLSVVAHHAKPDDSMSRQTNAELAVLPNVSRIAASAFGGRSDRLFEVVMGDLNADGSYLSDEERIRNPLFLRNVSKLVSLIGEDVDTTVAPSFNTYDRIFVDERLEGAVSAANVSRFDIRYGFNASFTSDISDHFPVQFVLSVSSSSSSLSSSFFQFIF